MDLYTISADYKEARFRCNLCKTCFDGIKGNPNPNVSKDLETLKALIKKINEDNEK